MIERTTVSGRPAMVAYVTGAMEPASEADATLAKVMFLDGEQPGIVFLDLSDEPAESRADDFDPSEPRDEGGKWTAGAGSAGKVQWEVPAKPSDDVIYRGMSAAEYSDMRSAGRIKARGTKNIGKAQQGLTYYSPDPQIAGSYAHGLSGGHRATAEEPAYVVAIKRPSADRIKDVSGNEKENVGIEGEVPASQIVGVYRGKPAGKSPLGIPGLHWEKVDEAPKTGMAPESRADFDPSEPRDEGGKWTEGGGSAAKASLAKTATNAEWKNIDIEHPMPGGGEPLKWPARVVVNPARFQAEHMLKGDFGAIQIARDQHKNVVVWNAPRTLNDGAKKALAKAGHEITAPANITTPEDLAETPDSWWAKDDRKEQEANRETERLKNIAEYEQRQKEREAYLEEHPEYGIKKTKPDKVIVRDPAHPVTGYGRETAMWGASHGGSTVISGHTAEMMGGIKGVEEYPEEKAGRRLAKEFLKRIANSKGSTEPLYHGFENRRHTEWKVGDEITLPATATAGDPDTVSYGMRSDVEDQKGEITCFEFPTGTPMAGYGKWQPQDAKEFGNLWSEAIVAGKFKIAGVRKVTHPNAFQHNRATGTADHPELTFVSLVPQKVFDPDTKKWKSAETERSKAAPKMEAPKTSKRTLKLGRKQVTLTTNPTQDGLKKLIADHGNMNVMQSEDGDIYAWPEDDASHGSVAEELEDSDKVRIDGSGDAYATMTVRNGKLEPSDERGGIDATPWFIEARADFDPSEDRDESGKWTSGASGAAKKPAMTATPQFKRWFGGSKVVDPKGKPLVVYKAMFPYDYTKETKDDPGPEVTSIERPSPFPDFNHSFPGHEKDPKEGDVHIAGFFGDKATANKFVFGRSSIFPVYLSMEKPFVIDAKGAPAGESQFGPGGKPFRDAIRSGDYDGVIIKNTKDEGDLYVALDPTKIKSAIGNKGTFDPKSKAITDSARADFDPSEPRDGSGKWAEGGGGSKATHWDEMPTQFGGKVEVAKNPTIDDAIEMAKRAEYHELRMARAEDGTVYISKSGESTHRDIQEKFGLPDSGTLRRLVTLEMLRDPKDKLRAMFRQDAFDPNEARDPGGKWTAGAGGSKAVPDEPGKAAIPEGRERRFHYTSGENVDSIRREGIKVAHSKGKSVGDPVAVWSNPDNPYPSGIPDDRALVEYHEDPKAHAGNPYAQTSDVPPENIVGIHEPWHDAYRYAKENGLKSQDLRDAGGEKYTRAAEEMDKEVPETGMLPVKPEAFVAARDKSTRPGFLSPHPASELGGHKLFTNKEGTVGVSVDSKGDVQNVFNNGGPKGGAAKALVAAIAAGGRTLDCYDEYLPGLYTQFGFEEDSRMKFNPDFAPAGWDIAKMGMPDIVFMSWRGYKPGGAQGVLDRVAIHHGKWPPPERSEVYGDDWDAAKERSRANAKADAGGTGPHRHHDEVEGPASDRAGDQSRAGAGPDGGRTVAGDAFDPSEPRDEGGKWTAGAGSGGAGKADLGEYTASYSGTKGQYDKRYFKVEKDELKDDDGTVVGTKEKTVPIRPIRDQVPAEPQAGVIFRGMSSEEFADAMKAGRIKSAGDYNLSNQQGLTYFSTDPKSAGSYASSFAPAKHKPSFDRPAYVVAVKRPADDKISKVKGTAEDEVGVNASIPNTDIVGVYRGNVIATGLVGPELHWEKLETPTAAKQVETPAFKKWFGDSKIVDEDGHPQVMYHGTLGDFDSFDKAKANTESDWGAGLYFTNDADDLSHNYAGHGPDITGRIENLAETIEQDDEWEGDHDDAKAEAAKQLAVQNEGAAMPVFLKMEKPFKVGGKDETFLDSELPYDEDTEEYGEPTGKAWDLIKALKDLSEDEDYFDRKDIAKFADSVSERLLDNDGIRASDLEDLARKSEDLAYVTDENGKLVAHDIIRKALQAIGFDGVIDSKVSQKFPKMEGMKPTTTHYIVFEPTQIKSAIGNKGTFDPKSKVITDSQPAPMRELVVVGDLHNGARGSIEQPHMQDSSP